jgi:hypothetical protein
LYTDELNAKIVSESLAAELIDLANHYKFTKLKDLVLRYSSPREPFLSDDTSISTCMEKLVNSPMFADVKLLCSNGDMLHAHKAWLCCRYEQRDIWDALYYHIEFSLLLDMTFYRSSYFKALFAFNSTPSVTVPQDIDAGVVLVILTVRGKLVIY